MHDDEARFARLVADTESTRQTIWTPQHMPSTTRYRPAAVAPEPTPYRWTGLEGRLLRAGVTARTCRADRAGGRCGVDVRAVVLIAWLAAGDVRRLSAAAWHHVRLCHRLPPAYLRPAVRHFVQTRRASADVPSSIDGGFASRAKLSRRGALVARAEREQIDTRGMATAAFWGNVFNRFDPGFTGLPVQYRHPFFDLRLVTYLLALPPAPWSTAQEAVARRDAAAAAARRRGTAQDASGTDPHPRAGSTWTGSRGDAAARWGARSRSIHRP